MPSVGIGVSPLMKKSTFSFVQYWSTLLNDADHVAFYDFLTPTSITKDGSDFISRWNDKLGSGRDLLQATGTNQPKYEADGVLFDGIDNFMNTAVIAALDQPTYVYLVINVLVHETWGIIIDGLNNSTGALFMTVGAGNVSLYAGQQGAGTDLLTYGSDIIIKYLIDGAGSYIKIDDVIGGLSSPGAGVMGGITMGADGVSHSIFTNFRIKGAIFRTADIASIYDDLRNYYSI